MNGGLICTVTMQIEKGFCHRRLPSSYSVFRLMKLTETEREQILGARYEERQKRLEKKRLRDLKNRSLLLSCSYLNHYFFKGVEELTTKTKVQAKHQFTTKRFESTVEADQRNGRSAERFVLVLARAPLHFLAVLACGISSSSSAAIPSVSSTTSCVSSCCGCSPDAPFPCGRNTAPHARGFRARPREARQTGEGLHVCMRSGCLSPSSRCVPCSSYLPPRVASSVVGRALLRRGRDPPLRARRLDAHRRPVALPARRNRGSVVPWVAPPSTFHFPAPLVCLCSHPGNHSKGARTERTAQRLRRGMRKAPRWDRA